MQDWLRTFHCANQAFPAIEIAVQVAVAFALGLLVGFEREWLFATMENTKTRMTWKDFVHRETTISK